MNKKGYVSVEVVIIAFFVITMSVVIAFNIASTSEETMDGLDNFIDDVIDLG